MTHEVTNQPPPLAGTNAWRGDPLLVQLAEDFPEPLRGELDRFGRFVRSPQAQELARLADSQAPVLRSHDAQGRRIDLVEYHPSYHALMRRSVAGGLHSSVWEKVEGETGRRHQARAARYYLTAQLESGHLGPIATTSASLAALMTVPALFREWAPRVLTRHYDPAGKPPVEKTGLTLGAGLAEKQAGTDLQAIATRAERAGNGLYRLSGHKWFLSAPMADAFLMLAQTGEGLSCFLVPRLLGDGSDNGLRFQRLKDMLGNRANACAEAEFAGAIGQMVGEPGRGTRAIADMVTLTRLDCAVGSAAIMRAGLAEAVHHARHRRVGGKPLADTALMQRVLADMALDVAGAAALSFRLARAFDNAAADAGEAAFARAMTPVVKYWVCKTAPALVAEAMECLGGNGYVEEGPLARRYREAPANAIWEGPGNAMALEVLRLMERGPELYESVIAGIGRGLGPSGQGTVEVLRAAAQVVRSDEGTARILTEQLAMSAAAAELRRLGAGRIADAFVESRLGGQWRSTYGMLDARHDCRMILDALYPDLG